MSRLTPQGLRAMNLEAERRRTQSHPPGWIPQTEDWAMPTGGYPVNKMNADPSSYPGIEEGPYKQPGWNPMPSDPLEVIKYLGAAIDNATMHRERASETAMELDAKLEDTRSLAQLLTRNIDAMEQARNVLLKATQDVDEVRSNYAPHLGHGIG